MMPRTHDAVMHIVAALTRAQSPEALANYLSHIREPTEPLPTLRANVIETADPKRLVSRATESIYDDQWNEQHQRSPSPGHPAPIFNRRKGPHLGGSRRLRDHGRTVGIAAARGHILIAAGELARAKKSRAVGCERQKT